MSEFAVRIEIIQVQNTRYNLIIFVDHFSSNLELISLHALSIIINLAKMIRVILSILLLLSCASQITPTKNQTLQ